MTTSNALPIATFGPFILDVDGGTLHQGEDDVHLQPLAFQLLTHMLRHPGRLFSRQELQDLLWPDTFVGDEALTQMIRRVRKAIEAPGTKPQWLITVPRRGYRFSEDVRWQGSKASSTEEESPRKPAAPEGSHAPPPSPATLLPLASGPFFGRDHSLATLKGLFAESARLITILGPGGLGKTRLATHFASDSLKEMPLTFVDLSGARDLDGLLMAVGSALGVPSNDASSKGSIERIGRVLGSSGPRALILDNFETVIDFGRAPLQAWLRLAPDARFIITSRERLDLGLEKVLLLNPLRTKDAKALFRQRARAAGATLAETKEEDQHLERLITQLDHSPLAIELAAGRAVTMGISQIIKRLDQRFQILRSRRQDLPRRHQSLQTVIEDSLSRLDGDSVMLLKAFARLPGPLSLETIEGLISEDLGDESAWVPDILQTLSDRSLLWMRSQEHLPPVFGMQENIRAYLRLGQAQASPPREERLQGVILSRLKELLLAPRGSLEIVTLVEAAFTFETPPRRWLADFAILVYPWFRERGSVARWSSLAQELLTDTTSLKREQIICLLINLSDVSPAGTKGRRAYTDRAHKLATAEGLPNLALETRLHALAESGGIGHFQEGLDHLPPGEDLSEYPLYLQAFAEVIYLVSAQGMGHLKSAAAARGDNPYATWRLPFKALQLKGTLRQKDASPLELGCTLRPTYHLMDLYEAKHAEACAYVLTSHGEIEEAKAHHNRALEIYKGLGWKRAEGSLLCNIAVAAMGKRESLPKARLATSQALGIFQGIGETLGVVKALNYRSFIGFLEGSGASGRSDAERGVSLAQAIDNQPEVISLLKNLTLLDWMEGDHHNALRHCREAGSRAEALGNPQRIWELQLYEAAILIDSAAIDAGTGRLREVQARMGSERSILYQHLVEACTFHLSCAKSRAAGEPRPPYPRSEHMSLGFLGLYIRRILELATDGTQPTP